MLVGAVDQYRILNKDWAEQELDYEKLPEAIRKMIPFEQLEER